MGFRSTSGYLYFLSIVLTVFICIGCNPARHIGTNEYLLRKNTVNLQTDKGITRRGTLRDNIDQLISQKTNTYLFLGKFPYKVWFYNLRYEKYQIDTLAAEKNKLVEKPVIYDSTLVRRSTNNIRSYLFNQGYFYPIVNDTTVFNGQKAYVRYDIETGVNFLIRKINIDVEDSTIRSIVNRNMEETLLEEGEPFAMSLLEQERSRITNVLREHGYYKFTQENIVDFQLDTFNKDLVRNIYNPFETAINFLASQKKIRNPTLDVKIVMRAENRREVYRRYAINNVTVYPDFRGREDVTDTTMYRSEIGEVNFRYHDYYVREKVIMRNIFLEKGRYYAQSDYDATINKLNQLGVFQTVRIFLADDTTRTDDTSINWLNAFILMTPSQKYDLTTSVEVSTGTTYVLGAMPTISFRNFNLGKGANLWTTSLSAGLESTFNRDVGDNFFKHFSLLTTTVSLNSSITFPKFLAPFGRFSKKNLPRTTLGFGTSWLDRVNFFTLTNTVANFTYNWRETSTNTWEVAPAFINIIRLPSVSDSFRRRLENNDFLRNSYRQTFIEGEMVAFTFSNQLNNKGRSYSYARFALEEAGGLLSLMNNTGLRSFNFSQYVRFDFDTRRYINRRRSQIAFRFNGGVGIPYGSSVTLPYIKQYFVGGAYSIRGWRIRTLGPGSYFDPEEQNSTANFIDRTGDIKLEMNGEYRFDVLQLFSGGIKIKGAVFADAGNIWLMKESESYPGGVFRLNKLGNDLAISTGAGARFDLAGFFIIRLDGAFPIKRPYNSTYDYGGWSNPFNRSWGLSDVVLNIAVGYPF